MYENLKNLIDRTMILNQGNEGEVNPEWIDDAEQKLGFNLPPSYRWWLLKYGSGFLDNSPIYTLAPPEFRDSADSDLLYADKINKQNGLTSFGRLYFYEPDGDQRYFFDMTRKDENQDNPVMVEDLAEQDIYEYGGNFSDFLRREIELRS